MPLTVWFTLYTLTPIFPIFATNFSFFLGELIQLIHAVNRQVAKARPSPVVIVVPRCSCCTLRGTNPPPAPWRSPGGGTAAAVEQPLPKRWRGDSQNIANIIVIIYEIHRHICFMWFIWFICIYVCILVISICMHVCVCTWSCLKQSWPQRPGSRWPNQRF